MRQQTDLLANVKSHFEHWRATRTKRSKISEYLWRKVKLLITVRQVDYRTIIILMSLILI